MDAIQTKLNTARQELSSTLIERDDEIDAWDLRKGREAFEAEPRYAELEFDINAVADFFGVAFLPEPELHPACIDSHRRDFITKVLDSPFYPELRVRTNLNETESSIAALALAEEYAKERLDPSEMESCASRAVREAEEALNEMDSASSAIGCGPGFGFSHPLRGAKIAAIYKRVRASPTLRRICERAGRARRLAESCQREKTNHGLDDVVGVTFTSDLSRALPSELVTLLIPGLREQTLQRSTEGSLMCLERTGVKPVGKGPICVTVDTSGSMSGPPVETAKAIALTMAYIARKQNRWCALIDYSGNEVGEVLALRPGEWDDEALCVWLEHFYSRGSYLDVPIKELPEVYWPRLLEQGLPRGKTDLIMITDALAVIADPVAEKFNRWRREEQVNVTGVIIRQEPGDLVRVCDRIHQVPTLSETDSTASILFSL